MTLVATVFMNDIKVGLEDYDIVWLPEDNAVKLEEVDKYKVFWNTTEVTHGTYLVTVKLQEKKRDKKGALLDQFTAAITVEPRQVSEKRVDELYEHFKGNIDGKLDNLANQTRNIADRLPEPGRPSPVALQRTTEALTENIVLWALIRQSTSNNFEAYQNFINARIVRDKGIFRNVRAYAELLR